ncbi:MAG TPA: protein-glutamate O-methyltransferase CheR [Geobacteraceae bacterium]|nr:protein-glutamate O-methyltransferase CheR [Geobacteraceae bacterium]
MDYTAETFQIMDEYFNRIALLLKERCRLSFAGHKRTILRRRLENRLEQLNLPDFSAYWDFLLGHPAEEGNLYDLATTNETSFFRNMDQFTFLKNDIIPRLEGRPAAVPKSIRILSAGCSTGEEPYSIAMTLLDALSSPDEWRLEIVAGDISESCLHVARSGYYENDRLRKLPGGYRERFMMSDADGARASDDLKKLVRFIRLNLDDLMRSDCPAWHAGLGFFDIIFCRNVMIYFAPSCQQQLVDTLHQLLLPGGYLFTGDAEPLHLFRHEFSPVAAAGCLIYQKTEKSLNE